MNTVFHLSTDDSDKVSELIGNLKNLKIDQTVDIETIAVVLNADGVHTVLKDESASEYLEVLAEEGVKLKVCSNSIEGQDIGEEELIDDIEIVSSGVGELNRLQDKDFNYIKI